jgi:hypothetical protein
MIFGLLAVSLTWRAIDISPDEPDRRLSLAWAALCFILGPVPCAVQLIRRRFLWVSLDADQGLITPRGEVIPWGAIESVEMRSGLFQFRRPYSPSIGWLALAGCTGCQGVLLLLVFGAFRIIFLPVISVLSPWHARVIIRLRDGHVLVYRDLEDDDDFVHRIRVHL